MQSPAITLGYAPQTINGKYPVVIHGINGRLKSFGTTRFEKTDTILTLKQTPEKHKIEDQHGQIITPERVTVTFNGLVRTDDTATLETVGINAGDSVTLTLKN